MRYVLYFFLVFLTGCSDHIVAGIKKRQQEILVHPEHINFGHIISGFDSGQETFQIINAGDKELTIFAPVLVSGNERFSLHTDQESYVIEPGTLLEFEILYVPATYESNGAYIEIISDDEDEPVSIITLEGYGDAPVMTVTPETFDYGDISIGCDNEERVTIRNDGNLDLVIDSVTQMVTQPPDILMEYGSLPDPPWVLIPGQEVDFLVSYIPTDIGLDESLITIAGNDPMTPDIEIDQYGAGDVEQWYAQQWEQDEIPILDVLWVIDNSGSMHPFQQGLSSNIGSFMSAFAASGADYHMSVITTDEYMFSTIIDWSTPNAEQLLGNLVVTGIMGSGHEKGIDMASRSLGTAMAAGPGGLFFRESAKLVVIFVSDEPDHSPSGWSSYIAFFDSIKPAGDFIPYGVIGDVPGGCDYQYGNHTRSAAAGYGYWDLIDHYGGNWYSICASDWGVQLQDLAGEVTGRRSFTLDEPDPIEDTIEVAVNGQITTEWLYDPALNAVVFNDGHVPEEGKTINITYAVWGCGG